MDVFTLGTGGKDSSRDQASRDLPSRAWTSLVRTRGRSPARRPVRRRVRGGYRVSAFGSSVQKITVDKPNTEIWTLETLSCRAKPTVSPLRLGRQDRGSSTRRRRPRMGTLAAWKAMPRTQKSTGRERAVGTHFPMLAAAIAAAALAFAARPAARFKPGFPWDFHPERDAGAARALRRSSLRSGNGHRWKPGISDCHTAFGSIDEVCRPRIGLDANALRGLTGLPCQATRLALLLLGK